MQEKLFIKPRTYVLETTTNYESIRCSKQAVTTCGAFSQ